MLYKFTYHSPIGTMLLAADGVALTGAWFEGATHFGAGLSESATKQELEIFSTAVAWLDAYFMNHPLTQLPPMKLVGTDFQLSVWQLLQRIPFGKTVTYGQLAKELAAQNGGRKVSAQAVGNAVGRNRLTIFLPCHRVVGANGDLKGYAGGLARKEFLLCLESSEK
ncbi:methylated-DNA--[protein]-cysteine S-methyltransferase [Gleimia sp. 6138-11-ORH1]|uniref:methylated-DNA--[protein]-cysteine S-methyltransferase n=1 Tax=Gleimia sp. 6138-11-ORH1 TaxID=2973937 RepID=UPI002166F70C|nr:methylated-DNA--[protein]-cysteine S-methyltransferase [Gleimia sp. 6138-11-ORH1]MCS4484518.1 methylated-DNA--[protein]-cysteine S-methyltransferase [Gleimia sp. 6138-11-ORH1]